MQVGLNKVELDTPVLWVDLDALEDNITHLAGYFRAAGVGWRPHTKGIKVPAIAHLALDAGALGVTCAKLGEAEVMAAAGIRDIRRAPMPPQPGGGRKCFSARRGSPDPRHQARPRIHGQRRVVSPYSSGRLGPCTGRGFDHPLEALQ